MLCHGTMQRVCHKYLKTMLSAIQWYYLNSVIYMPLLFFFDKKCYVFASQMEPLHSLFQNYVHVVAKRSMSKK